jgi:Ca2+-binding RTX toxin-like protein
MTILAAAPNLLTNGDFSQSYTGWTGFLNLVNAPTAADDYYVNKPFSNLKLQATGAVEFIGFWDPSGPGSYAYRLAPASPHLSQTVYLDAGSYTLSYDFQAITWGMNINQKFEVKLDGVQVDLQGLWVQQPSGLYGAAPAGARTVTLQVATAGNHTLSFGFNQPGYNIDTAGSYVQYANHAILDNVVLSAGALPPPPVNQAPTGSATAVLAGGTEDTPLTLTAAELLQGFSDADGDTLAVTGLTASAGSITDHGDGTFTLTPTAQANGTVTLNYTVSDGQGGTVAATQSLVLVAVNDAPTGGVAITGTAAQGQVLSAVAQFTDADGLGALDWQWLAGGAPIAGATSAQYTVTSADLGLALSVVARYTDGGGTAESVSSPDTAPVLPPLPVAGLVLTGTAAANALTGDAGNDTLTGLAGRDTLTGLGGDDVLDGGAAADVMDGGDGSDRYLVNKANEHGAAEIGDTGATGTDEVRFTATSAGTLTLYAADTGIERVVIGTGSGAVADRTGTTALNLNATRVLNALELLGNAGSNALRGSAFDDTLDGGAGIDTLIGGAGNDIYIVDLSALGTLQDTVTDSGGDSGDSLVLRGAPTLAAPATLKLAATLEHLDASGTGATALHLDGNTAANALTGNGAANALNGLDGNDTLTGGAGADTLDGGTGADLLVYRAATESNTAATDTLKGFDFGGPDAATGADLLRFEGLALTGASSTDITGTQLKDLPGVLDAALMPAGQAVLVHVLNGVAMNRDFLFVDANGVDGYQPGADYAIELVGVVNRTGFDLSDLLG